MKRVSVDVGGTLTDCFVTTGERYIQATALTTHHNLALGFNQALDIASGDLANAELEAALAAYFKGRS